MFRFDGARATPLPLRPGNKLENFGVRSLLIGRDGKLWIGTTDGLLSWTSGHIDKHPEIGDRRVNALLEDRNGAIWAGTIFGGLVGRLCSIANGSTRCYGDDGSLGSGVVSLYEDSNGSFWVAASNGLWRWKPGPPTRYIATPFLERQTLIKGDHDTGLLVAGVDGVHQVNGASVLPYPGVGDSLPHAVRLLRDRNGGLWIGTDAAGLIHAYGGKTSTFTHKDGLSNDQVKALFEDNEGNIWVGTSAGVDQFRELAVTSLSIEEGLSNAVATSVLAARDGSIWVGTVDGLNRRKDGRVTVYRTRTDPGLRGDRVQSLFEDDLGRIWIATDRGLSVFERGTLRSVPFGPAEFGQTFAIVGDHNAGIWVSVQSDAAESGLFHLSDGKVIGQTGWAKLGGGWGSGGLLADELGGVWVGMDGGGLAYFSKEGVRNLRLSKDTVAGNRVTDLARGRDGALWAATQNGLSRVTDGRVTTLTTANGLPCNTVHWFIEDRLSSAWLYTECGLLRVVRSELDRWVAEPTRTIRVIRYDDADGIRLVPGLSRLRPEVTQSPDGMIWFVNDDTVSFFNPSHLAENRLPPPVHLEKITADGKTYDIEAGLHLPPLVRDVTFEYTGLSLAVPEKVHFKYKLEGQDADWKQVVNERQVHYSNLRSGNYRFRVIASNNSGVWNEAGASLEFSVMPAYWQTAWFRALCGAACIGLLILLYWLRGRQLARQFDMRLEAQVEERTRIARELHDTLLQSFNGLLLRFRTVQRLLSTHPDEAREMLGSAIDDAREALSEGRQAVQGLRSPALEQEEFSQAIRALTEELASDPTSPGAVEIRLNTEGAPRALQPLVRDEMFRITSEALRNAFRHSDAHRIEVQLGYDARRFELRVRDDGKGIDPKFLSDVGLPGHFGLPGMRERAQRMGAEFTVWSAPESGTEIAVILPGAKAYGKESVRPSWIGGRLFAARRDGNS